MGNAEDRFRARWQNSPKRCQHRWNGLKCSRDVNHAGRHFDPAAPPAGGYWGEEFRDMDGKPQPRAQFCDLDWQDRFTANPDAPSFYASYEVGSDRLFTVGTVGGVYMTKKQYPVFVENLRKWADMIEEYMQTYETE